MSGAVLVVPAVGRDLSAAVRDLQDPVWRLQLLPCRPPGQQRLLGGVDGETSRRRLMRLGGWYRRHGRMLGCGPLGGHVGRWAAPEAPPGAGSHARGTCPGVDAKVGSLPTPKRPTR